MKARVLCEFEIEGQRFAPELTVIDAPESVIDALVAAGNADADPAAVDYALANGAETVVIGTVDAESAPKTTRRKKARTCSSSSLPRRPSR